MRDLSKVSPVFVVATFMLSSTVFAKAFETSAADEDEDDVADEVADEADDEDAAADDVADVFADELVFVAVFPQATIESAVIAEIAIANAFFIIASK